MKEIRFSVVGLDLQRVINSLQELKNDYIPTLEWREENRYVFFSSKLTNLDKAQSEDWSYDPRKEGLWYDLNIPCSQIERSFLSLTKRSKGSYSSESNFGSISLFTGEKE